MSRIEMPAFQSESDEADWWFDNQDAIAQEFLDKYAPGQQLLELLLTSEDMELAHQRALAQGVTTEHYVRELVHRSLQ